MWQGLGTSGKSLSRDECEQIIGKLLYDGLLKLEMGYTAYATNSYLKLSPLGSRLLQGALLPHLFASLQTYAAQLAEPTSHAHASRTSDVEVYALLVAHMACTMLRNLAAAVSAA